MSTLAKKDKKTIFLEPFKGAKKLWGKASNEAEQLLNELDFPTSKTENWKYTRVGKLSGSAFSFQPHVASLDLSDYMINKNYHLLVFVNGFYREDLSGSKPGENKGWSFQPASVAANKEIVREQLQTSFFQNDLFTVLNTAYSQDGYVLTINKNVTLEKPVHVLNIIDGEQVAVLNRNLILAGENAEAKIIETFYSTDGSTGFVNRITELNVAANARVMVDKLQNENPGIYHVATDQVNQDKGSMAKVATITLNGDWIRNNLNFSLNGTNCETSLVGLYFLDGKQHVDNHTYVYHGKPNCLSNELYKGVMAGKSTGVFNGKVFVERDAQQTNAYQSNANVLLTDDATINSKPELEIYADDVKCSHGSTVGQLDEEAMFYLRSRGIGKESARKILVRAFAEDVIEQVTDNNLKEKILSILDEKFQTIKL